MDLREVLRKHEKGIEYAFTLEGLDRYPIILDKNDDVLSFPPIINGILTMVTEDTKNIFLDLTGTDFKAVNYSLNIISTLLAERGSKIETVDVIYEDKTITTPDLTPWKMPLKMDYLNKTLAMEMKAEEAVKHLERMRFGASVLEPGVVEALVPAYRTDILHPIDLVEDIAISYGYMKLEPMHPMRVSFANTLEISEYCNKLRSIMTGFGYNEVVSFTLSSEKDQFERLNLEASERIIIKNPITEDHTCVRTSLLPNLLNVLQINRRRDLPQKIFEVGIVLNQRENQYKLAGASAHPKASFTEIKAIVEGIISRLGAEYEIKPSTHNSLIDGRRASIQKDGESLGDFGEVHPEVIINFELSTPIACFELDIDKLNKHSL
jgi:phenylalanyl-tRNA synthetase beta chain